MSTAEAMLRSGGPMTVPQMGGAQALSRQFVQRMVNEAAARGHAGDVYACVRVLDRLLRLLDDVGMD